MQLRQLPPSVYCQRCVCLSVTSALLTKSQTSFNSASVSLMSPAAKFSSVRETLKEPGNHGGAQTGDSGDRELMPLFPAMAQLCLKFSSLNRVMRLRMSSWSLFRKEYCSWPRKYRQGEIKAVSTAVMGWT